jgi:hypothetical protein
MLYKGEVVWNRLKFEKEANTRLNDKPLSNCSVAGDQAKLSCTQR